MSAKTIQELRAFLHLGPEKTGTSFLQHLCVRHRDLLGQNGIVFPHGTPHDERCMRDGQISAGNGRVLASWLKADDWDAVSRWVGQVVLHARQNNGRRLLISSEHLLAPLAQEDRLIRLTETLKSAGVSTVSLLLILRDPVGQLISLYKHRAKGGTAGGIEDWVNDGYRLPYELHALHQQVAKCDAELVARAYRRQSSTLESVFFADWLGLGESLDAGTIEVNPSLALSELELIRRMAARKPALVPFLYRYLAAVPADHKSQSSALDAHAQAVAEAVTWQHRDEWQRWNERLPEGEALQIPEQAPEIPEWPKELGFSSLQLDALARFMAESTKLRFLARVFWASRLRPGLANVKRWLKTQGSGRKGKSTTS